MGARRQNGVMSKASLPPLTETEMDLVSELVVLGLDRDDLGPLRGRLAEVPLDRREKILRSLSGFLHLQIAWFSARAHAASIRYRELEALLRGAELWRDSEPAGEGLG